MSEVLRDEALALVRAAFDYIAECEKRGVPCAESEDLRQHIALVLGEEYAR